MQTLRDHLQSESLQKNKATDIQLEFEAKIDKKETQIHSLKEEVVKYRDEIRGKDEAIKALSMTLIEKGKENQRLAEMVVEIKNHHLMTQILGQKFHVQKPGPLRNEDLIFRFIHDKSREQEYFLEIANQKGQALRQIAVCDIEEIEPMQGTKFMLSYVTAPIGSSLPLVGAFAMRA